MIQAADGLHLFAETAGTGPEAIVIPQRIYLREYFERLANGRTVIFYDPRNRGLSETVTDAEKLSRGILHDVDDLEAIRAGYGLERISILADSYIALAAILYAAAFTPGELCRKFWALLLTLYVASPGRADDLHWEPCDFPK